MDREIKFRAWDTQDKEMWNWEEHDREICWHLSGECSYDIILMQYTGLKDKNGVEIYEGDILGYGSGEIYGVVIWGTHKWIADCGGDSCIPTGWWIEQKGNNLLYELLYISELDNYKIIGNIYENPELLK